MKHVNEIKHAFEQYLQKKSAQLPHESEIAYLLKKIWHDDREAFKDVRSENH